MPQYAQVIKNITGIYVASLKSDNTYNTPAYVEYGGDVSFEFEMDENELDAYGMTVESLAVVKKATGSFQDGTFNFAVLKEMVGGGSWSSQSESGSTPNRYQVGDVLAGGEGNGYFGMIAAFAGTNGSNMLVGFPKAMLGQFPAFDAGQNEFRVTEVDFNAYAPSTAIRKAVRFKRNETAASIPTTANDFLAFFTAPTNMFA